jgi:hypothetical protein
MGPIVRKGYDRNTDTPAGGQRSWHTGKSIQVHVDLGTASAGQRRGTACPYLEGRLAYLIPSTGLLGVRPVV